MYNNGWVAAGVDSVVHQQTLSSELGGYLAFIADIPPQPPDLASPASATTVSFIHGIKGA